MPKIIDAHHHFWDPARGHFPWMAGDAMAPIRRVFAPEHLAPLLRDARVDATVLVQTQASLDETRDFLATAAATPFVAGVVGWVDLTSPAAGDDIAALKARPDGRYLVGIRHLVQDEADPDWLLRTDVRRGLKAVEAHGLVYDLLLKPRDLPAATRLVAEMPGLRFVVDHIAKPMIGRGIYAPWAEQMRAFRGQRDHVWCKLSGMVTEANWRNWTADDLRPYVETALSTFGTARCLFGSDWPVCTLAGSYLEVKGALEECTSGLTVDERAAVYGGTAAGVYALQMS
ncbi:MAG: amidohydrolase family protein [Alphaproteobacteria bacterium]|nr:amidohydrolase family protein [Alphaproteobacteria bacterium]